MHDDQASVTATKTGFTMTKHQSSQRPRLEVLVMMTKHQSTSDQAGLAARSSISHHDQDRVLAAMTSSINATKIEALAEHQASVTRPVRGLAAMTKHQSS
jgi:hypothetical protein